MKIALVILGVLFGLLRFNIRDWATAKQFGLYTHLAHVYMGALLVCWLLNWTGSGKLWRVMFWTLCAVEVYCALHHKGII